MDDTGLMDRNRGRVAFDNMTALKATVEDVTVNKILSGGTVTATLAAAYTMPDNGVMYILDPGGAHRDVILPDTADFEGRMLVVINTADAAENLNVRETTAGTIRAAVAQNEQAFLFSDGARWYGLVGSGT